jgi:amidase
MTLAEISVDACRRAIRAKNGEIRAVLSVLREPQRDESATPHAPLFGIPYVLKDCWDTRGIHTTGGSWRHRDRVPLESGPLHRALAKSGAVLLGKSNLSDLCFSPESDNHLIGATRNPFDLTRTAGGSTGGGAAAVATGMAAFDWGGDFGGSIRMPAACCGVTGLRLSQAAWPGAVEQFPRLSPFFLPMLGYGPLARTVGDCRVVMNALWSALRADVGSTAMMADDVVIYAPDAKCTGEWPTFVADAAHALMREGVRFEIDRTMPPPFVVNDLFNAYLSAHLDELSSTEELPVREALPAVAMALASRGVLDLRVHPNTAILFALVQVGNLTLYRKKKRAADDVHALREAAHAVWSRGKLIVAPTSTQSPPRHGRAYRAWTWQAYTKLGNLLDSTSIAIPFGRFASGMPRSIQVLGPPGSETAVLALAERLERAAPFSR